MASVASRVVFHPAVSRSLKIGSTTLGRDKLYRTIQYFARFYAYVLISRGDKESAIRWTALKSHLGTARKLLRLGKPVEHLQALLRAYMASEPPKEQITSIGRQLGYFGFLSLDGLVWANSIKFLNLNSETGQKIAKTSNRLWLAGIMFSILNSVFKILRLSREHRSLQYVIKFEEKGLSEQAEHDAKIQTIRSSMTVTRRQLMTDLLDIWIPATALNHVSLNEGVLGAFGFITSVMALEKQWAGK